jgi:lysophospholipase L1-like esterase
VRTIVAPLRERYRDRIAEFERNLTARGSDAGPTVVLFGDSISQGHPATELRGRRVFNMGISGDQADHAEAGLLRRVPLVARANPAEVFLLIGINDLNDDKPVETLVSQITAVLDALKSAVPRATIFVQSVLPTSGEFLRLLPNVKAVNERLVPLARSKGCEYADLFTSMSDGDGVLREEFTTDGVHLSEQGYEHWTKLIERAPRTEPAARGAQ